MTVLSLRLPQSLHRQLGDLAAREDVSINQLISSKVAEKMSALMTEDYLNARAVRGTRRSSSPRWPKSRTLNLMQRIASFNEMQ